MLLVPLGCPLLTFTSFIQHLTNVFVLAVDFILSGYPVDLRHFAIIVFIVAVYASFVQVFYVMNGSTNCVYPFLMPNCPLSVVYVSYDTDPAKSICIVAHARTHARTCLFIWQR